MEKKLNLNDIFGFLVPGAVVCAAVYAYLLRTARVSSLDSTVLIAMIPAAYVVGLLLHQLGSVLMHEQRVAIALMDGDSYFTPEFKQRVKAAFTEVFRLPTDTPAALQTMFNGCYDYVIQQGKGIYVESNYAVYSLCRSMMFVSVVVGVLGWAFVLGRRMPHPLTAADCFHLAMITTFTGVALGFFRRARDQFIRYFARGVYRAFYSAYCDLKTFGRKEPTAPDVI